MAVEIITKDDLEQFGIKLIDELKNLILKAERKDQKKWLRSQEVRKLLNISAGTLQNLCLNDVLHPTKIVGINYYSADEIEKLLENK